MSSSQGGRREWRPHEKVPQFDPSKQTVRDYRRHVAVFQLRTAIPIEKQGPELYAELKGPAWEQAEELDPTDLFEVGGVTILLDFLAKKFDDTKVMELGDELRKFSQRCAARAASRCAIMSIASTTMSAD